MVMGMDFRRERVLRGGGREKSERGVDWVARLSLEMMKGRVWKVRRSDGGENRANDGVGRFDGGDEGGGGNLCGGKKTGTAELDREKGQGARGFSEVPTKKTNKRGKLERVEAREDRKESVREAGAKAVRHLRKGVAEAEKKEFDLGVVETRESGEDGSNFVHPGGHDVAGEGYITHGSSQEMKAVVTRPWDAAVERVENGGVEIGTRVDEGFLRVESEPNAGALVLQKIVGSPEIGSFSHKGDVIQK